MNLSWELDPFSTFAPPLFSRLLLYHFANLQLFELSAGSFINIYFPLHPFDGELLNLSFGSELLHSGAGALMQIYTLEHVLCVCGRPVPTHFAFEFRALMPNQLN